MTVDDAKDTQAEGGMSSMLDSREAFDLSAAHIRSRSASAAYTAWPCSNNTDAWISQRHVTILGESTVEVHGWNTLFVREWFFLLMGEAKTQAPTLRGNGTAVSKQFNSWAGYVTTRL